MEVSSQRTPIEIRNSFIPLPSKEEGYSTVLLLGVTGAGKTTLLRQMIGSHPKKDRFPSTAPGKTTVCDMELIIQETIEYNVIVTFFSIEKIRTYISECLMNAAKAHIEGESDHKVVQRFIVHPEERFRLNYILGNVKLEKDQGLIDDDDDEDGNDDDFDETETTSKIRREQEERLKVLIDELKSKSTDAWNKLQGSFDGDGSPSGTEQLELSFSSDEEKFLRFEETFSTSPTFRMILESVLIEVKKRFDYITTGNWEIGPEEWPVCWTFTSTNRSEVIDILKRITGNHKSYHGELLTPLVQGVRLSGPFKPIWHDEGYPKLVFMDGEGLFHQASDNTALPTELIKKIEQVDAVLLVDNATQAVTPGPTALIKEMVSSGQEDKLFICFTHFDGVKGDSLPGVMARREHVLSSLENGITHIAALCGPSAIRSLRHRLDERVFFVGSIQKIVSPKGNAATVSELRKLMKSLSQAGLVPQKEIGRNVQREIISIVDEHKLHLLFRRNMKDFYNKWDGILGLNVNSTYRKENYTRIKAMTKRIMNTEYGYDGLYPATDMLDKAKETIAQFIDEYVTFQDGASEKDQDALKSEMRRAISTQLNRFVIEELIHEPKPDWTTAYQRRGTGSSTLRARDVKKIFENVIGELVEEDDPLFLSVRDILFQEIRDVNTTEGADKP
ncbi:hypothetical protein GJ688_16330 [Heliobacillus mobilis]|uniref:AAA+ ATPase domain-containing protein n=1 Tax=Heliobacterium mobile TaxID=28064 RepID=A0A6I3SNB1_HELMO|nr:hypothetical protein [Heliobacterium mobile]MTV50513.1 hypothetical protein [Heliobacterium mobile]